MPETPEPTPEEQAAIEAADAYLDAIGNGLNIPGDQLGATELRQDIDREPVAWPNFPSTHTASGNQPPAKPKGTLTVSNTESAGQLNEMAHGDHIKTAAAALTQADVSLGELAAQAQIVVSEGQSHELIQGAIQQTRQAIADITQLLGATQQTLLDAAARMRNV